MWNYVSPLCEEQRTKDIAAIALQQIKQGAGFDVMASWGVFVAHNGRYTLCCTVLRWRQMPALALHVHGFLHRGWVIVSLNECTDTYEVELADEQFYAKEGSRVTDVYCDQLGVLIDTMVERGTCSDGEYKAKIAAQYPELEWAAKQQGRQVVYL